MNRILLILAVLPMLSTAQEVVDYFGGMTLRPGLYADFQSFRANRPTYPLERLHDTQGLAVTDLRRTSGKLSYRTDTGSTRTVDLTRMWGFCQNDVVYISAGNGFYRIGLMGALAHLVVEQTFRDWDPYLYGYGTVTRTVLVQQLLDMETGRFLPFNAGGIDAALVHDPVLSEEFRALSKKQRNRAETHFRFLRMYNERNPLIFPP